MTIAFSSSFQHGVSDIFAPDAALLKASARVSKWRQRSVLDRLNALSKVSRPANR
jgi:hypothetical protein